jgi:two-component system LytT family response regulator
MTKIHTILVDDEARGLNSLQKMLQQSCPQIETVACCDNADDAKKKILELEPQLVFLDIAMPVKNGLDLLNELPGVGFEVIFVTAHDNYLLQALHFSAVDYLLKPIGDDQLKEAVRRAEDRIARGFDSRPRDTLLHNRQTRDEHRKSKLCIPSLKGFQVVELDQIIYCEASGNYTLFFTSDGKPPICASRPIHEYEALLEDSGFIRVHKSHLINMEHVKEYQRGEGGRVVLSNDFAVEVSRRKKDVFIERMKAFFKY